MSLDRNALIELIQELTPVPGLDADTIAASQELLTGGIIDSLGLLQIVEAIEKSAGIKVPAHMISMDNFNSLAGMESLQAKLAA